MPATPQLFTVALRLNDTQVFAAFQPRFTPCSECGATVDRASPGDHDCHAERLLELRLYQLRDEIAAFDAQLANWLQSARGRFEAWIAERDRLAAEASS